jgi:hypothetical protein
MARPYLWPVKKKFRRRRWNCFNTYENLRGALGLHARMDFVDAEFSVDSAPFGRSRSANETGAAGGQPRCINEPLSKPLRVTTRRQDQAEPGHWVRCVGAGAFRTGSDRLAREIVRAFTVPFFTGTFRGLVERAPHVATKIRDGRSRKEREREERPLPTAATGSEHSHSEIVSPRVDPSSPREG